MRAAPCIEEPHTHNPNRQTANTRALQNLSISAQPVSRAPRPRRLTSPDAATQGATGSATVCRIALASGLGNPQHGARAGRVDDASTRLPLALRSGAPVSAIVSRRSTLAPTPARDREPARFERAR